MNTNGEEIAALSDLLIVISSVVERYGQASYAQRKGMCHEIYQMFSPDVAQRVEWIARVLASPNQLMQVTELYACLVQGLPDTLEVEHDSMYAVKQST